MAPQQNPDSITPEWSRALAEVASSPYWGDWDDAEGTEHRDTFIEQALGYPTYDDLPGDLKVTFDRAYRAWRAAARNSED